MTPIKESLRQQIWTAANHNLYTVIICMQRCGGWRSDGDINFYTRVLNAVLNLKHKQNASKINFTN